MQFEFGLLESALSVLFPELQLCFPAFVLWTLYFLQTIVYLFFLQVFIFLCKIISDEMAFHNRKKATNKELFDIKLSISSEFKLV